MPSSFLPKCLPAPTPASGQSWTTPPSQRHRGEKVNPQSSWGRAAFWQNKHQCTTHWARQPNPLLVHLGDVFEGSQSPHTQPHVPDHPEQNASPSTAPPHCGVKPHLPESPGTFALGALITQDLPHKETQLKLLLSILRLARLAQFAAPTPKTTLFFQALQQVTQMIPTGCASRHFSLHHAWNYYQEVDIFSFKCCWGHLFNH